MSCANNFVFGVSRKGHVDEVTQEVKPEMKPEVKPDVKPVLTSEFKLEIAPEVKLEVPSKFYQQVKVTSNVHGYEEVDEKVLFDTQSLCSQVHSDKSEATANSVSADSISDKSVQPVVEPPRNGVDLKSEITDEVIAEMMSGEAEVLKEHNVIG